MKKIQKIERYTLIAIAFFVFYNVLRMCVAVFLAIDEFSFPEVARLVLIYGALGFMMFAVFVLLFGKKE